MNTGGALCIVAACLSLGATSSVAMPPPPPGGYTYYNDTPATVVTNGRLIDQSTSTIIVTTEGGGPTTTVGTLTSQVYREDASGTLDFVYHITPTITGVTLHSLDVPWINNEVTLSDAGFSATADGEAAPDLIARFYDSSPATFLFDIRNAMSGGNLDNGTTDLVLITNAHAYTNSDGFTARTVDPNLAFATTGSLSGLIPEHAPEPASLGVVAIGALALLRRPRRA